MTLRAEKPRFAVIVPARRAWPLLPVVKQLRERADGAGSSEIVLATGRCPSQQRNLAAEAAEGEVLAFVDDDVVPGEDWLSRLAEWYANPRVVGPRAGAKQCRATEIHSA